MPDENPPGGYRVVKLTVQNVKRIAYADITPEGNLVVLAGANGAGKSSILDSIMWALAGGRSFTDVEQPIRHGAKRGQITVDLENRLTLGRFHVVRTFTKGGTNLSVEDEHGPVKDQQAVLTALIGEHSFDPFKFMRLPKRDQRATLLSVVDLDVDLDELARERDEHYAERTIVGRQRDALANRLDAMVPPTKDTPTEEVSIESKLAELNVSRETNAANREARNRVVNCEGDLEESEAGIETIEVEIGQLEERIAALKADRQVRSVRHAELEAHLEVFRRDIVGLVDVDTAAIEADMAQLDSVNRAVRAGRDYRVLDRELGSAKADYDERTRRLDLLEEKKIAALERAVMPVQGLSFDDDGLYYQRSPEERPVPIGQCADSEQLRVSVAIAVALNPKLRVMRVKEGALLDKTSLGLLRELADEHNVQVWLEMVEDGDGEPGWLIVRDGAIVGAQTDPSEGESE